ncbi:uncharacterized protein TRAVEDRAFT_24792 [Trametes versicolor FP-101664 SS1]|uniref:Uncharacterized protein n=1 Tax=Trametes versicolor (strain FP-101664) TaxID=717944 RepID=R7S7Z3_TRAVS|nr:uncharacterized protein TRAVEDRAFT_24792 [Trametes versicolor FP-101664 SS1]EIW52121.1 hypothetical protein TRAVEDRAFT_24792 [Trametes versicolor FP-101664 SS1]
MPCLFWLPHFLFLVASALGVLSISKIVDDADSSIIYSPAAQWTQGPTCVNCAILPDASLAHDETWHYATYDPTEDTVVPSITFNFRATGVAVHNILPPFVPTAPSSNVELAFVIDGEAQPNFSFTPQSADTAFVYDQVVMSVGNLSFQEHTLIIRMQSNQASVVLFDFLELTLPDQAVEKSHQSSTSASTSTAPAVTTIVTVTSTQRNPGQIVTTLTLTSSLTSSASQASTVLSLPQSPALVASSSDGTHATSNLQLSQGASSMVMTSETVPGALGSATISTQSPSQSQSQSAIPVNGSTVSSTTIGAAAGGGALLIIIILILGKEMLPHNRTEAANGGDKPSEQTRGHEYGPTPIHHSLFPGFPNGDPFVDGNEDLGLLAPEISSSGDVASFGGGAAPDSNLSAGTMVTPALRSSVPLHEDASLHTSTPPSTFLDGWNTDEKDDPESTPGALQAGNGAPRIVGQATPRPEELAEQLAALREEVAQIRRYREARAMSPLEAPPQYSEP